MVQPHKGFKPIDNERTSKDFVFIAKMVIPIPIIRKKHAQTNTACRVNLPYGLFSVNKVILEHSLACVCIIYHCAAMTTGLNSCKTTLIVKS
jgi:hypothetical protein